MVNDASGHWLGLGVGDVDNPDTPRSAPNWHAIALLTTKLHDKYQWARDLGVTPQSHYDVTVAAAVEQFCKRTGLPVIRDPHGDAVAKVAMRRRLGSYPPPAPVLPIFLTIEGHCSDMFHGPVADTADILEHEGLCWHQPVGYENCNIPFTTQTAVDAAAELLSRTSLPGPPGQPDRPFLPGTPWVLGHFSEGGIAGFELHAQHLAPGGDLEWREKDRLGTLAYGNPCRATDSVAPWAQSWGVKPGSHGLDPYRRYELPGCPALPRDFMDVLRRGDLFAENLDDLASQLKSSVYLAVARGDFFGSKLSIAQELAAALAQPVTYALGIVEAIFSGIVFLGDNPNPHYSPYNISGGLNWVRGLLQRAASAAA
jgi:hypothetical protein